MKPPIGLTFISEVSGFLLVFILVKVVDSRYVQHVESLSSSCGHLREGRVMGGDETELGEFPWIASIQTQGGQHFCAGFLISNSKLVSAAHCFTKQFNSLIDYNKDKSVKVESMKIVVNLVQLSDHSDSSRVVDVAKVTIHPDFDVNNLNNDIAILELKQDVQWEKGIFPICLPKVPNEEPDFGNVTVAGWGYRQCGSYTPSNELHKITVPLWDADTCKKSYEETDYDFTRRDYICAGSEGKDISKGDSGGPLMMISDSEKRWTVIGIVSSGKFMCSDKVPGLYTKVSSYLEWLKTLNGAGYSSNDEEIVKLK